MKTKNKENDICISFKNLQKIKNKIQRNLKYQQTNIRTNIQVLEKYTVYHDYVVQRKINTGTMYNILLAYCKIWETYIIMFCKT